MLEFVEINKSYPLRLLRKEKIADETYSFVFEKPSGFTHIAGQSMKLHDPVTGERKTMSIVSAPHAESLEFAMRMRESEFKKRYKSLEPGSMITMDGPRGHFIIEETADTPLVFIAGGIGITLFISMLSDISHRKTGHKVTLFCSNRRVEDIPFKDRLEKLAEENPNIKVVYTLSKESEVPGGWSGDKGRINGEMIQKYVDFFSFPHFYVAGPPSLVNAMDELLRRMGVEESALKTKRFTGYGEKL